MNSLIGNGRSSYCDHFPTLLFFLYSIQSFLSLFQILTSLLTHLCLVWSQRQSFLHLVQEVKFLNYNTWLNPYALKLSLSGSLLLTGSSLAERALHDPPSLAASSGSPSRGVVCWDLFLLAGGEPFTNSRSHAMVVAGNQFYQELFSLGKSANPRNHGVSPQERQTRTILQHTPVPSPTKWIHNSRESSPTLDSWENGFLTLPHVDGVPQLRTGKFSVYLQHSYDFCVLVRTYAQ